MFRPEPMMRLSAVVLQRDERAVLRDLGRLGTLQLIRSGAGPAPRPPPDRGAEIARLDGLLARIAALRRTLDITVPAAGGAAVLAAAAAEPVEAALAELEARSDRLLQSRQRLLKRQAEWAAVGGRVARYHGLALPLEGPDAFTFLHFVTGFLPAEKLGQLEAEAAGAVALLPLPAEGGRRPLIAMTTRQDRPALEQLLQRLGFQADPLPVAAGTTTDGLAAESRREQEQAAAELARWQAERQLLVAESAPRLAVWEQRAGLERQLLEAEQHFTRTAAAVLVSAWIPAREAPAALRRVREVTGGRCAVEAAAPAAGTPDEQIPVLLRHPRWLQPFAGLMTAYGVPCYRDVEPTLFVAVSYLLMFGMMFGDLGQGAVLAAAGAVAWFAGRTGTVRDAGLLLLGAGLASGVFGVVYGSCFGLPQFRSYALWHDPLEGDPAVLMGAAVGVGVVLISLGLVLNVINRLRRGDVAGALLDKFGVLGALFYWGALVLLLNPALLRKPGVAGPALALVLGVPLAGWLLRGPLEQFRHRHDSPAAPGGGRLLEAVAESFAEAFEALLSYLANTISFVRLAAYALSHAALLAAAFLMAEQARQLPVGGGVAAVLLIVAGNLAAIVLEGVIAAIQALRLEYYEFFGKFFQGGGRLFTPFRLPLENVAAAPP